MMTTSDPVTEAFNSFVRVEGLRLRRAMSARYGIDVGCDATNAALGFAWERWDQVSAMDNPAGYLYRVAQTKARRDLARGRPLRLPPEHPHLSDGHEGLDDDLAAALRNLSESQRLSVLLVHAYGWTPAEVASMSGSSPSTVRSHLRRGLRRLRSLLPESDMT